MSLDPNSDASERKHQLVKADAHTDALMPAPLTHSIECPGPDPGMGLGLQKAERIKSQAKDASGKKEAPLSQHAFVEKNRIKANKKAFHKLQMSLTLPTHRISKLCASAPVKLLYCPRCRNTPAAEGWVHPEHEWAVILSCPSSSCPRWSVCRACPNARVHLDSEESFARHRIRYHRERERSTQVRPGNFVTSDN
jgi:hypothetical protein